MLQCPRSAYTRALRSTQKMSAAGLSSFRSLLNACLKLALITALMLGAISRCFGQQSDTALWQQRSLGNLLFHFNQQGWQLIFTDKLVRDDMILSGPVPEGDDLTRLQTVLARFGLTFVASEQSPKSGFVVKASPSQIIHPVIYDALTGEAITRFQITIDDRAISDVDAIAIYSPWMQNLRVSAKGFYAQEIAINDWPKNHVIRLQPVSPEPIESVWVTASFRRWQAPPASAPVTHDQHALNQKPARANDPLVAVADTPGFVTNSVSVRPYVRGGNQDELQVLIDGVELYNPYHLEDFQSLISGFNGPVVASIASYTGGYPARFGSTMSGVMSVTSALPENGHEHTLEINPVFSALTLSHGKPSQEGYLLSLRRGNLETVVSALNENEIAPRFFDVFAKKQWRDQGSNLWRVGAFLLNDDVNIHREDELRHEDAWSLTKTQYGWLQYHTGEDELWQHRWQGVISHISHLRFGSAEEQQSYFGNLNDRRRQDALELSWQVDGELNFANINAGLQLGWYDAHIETAMDLEREGIADILGLSNNVSVDSARNIFQHRGGSFIAFEWLSDAWQTTLGGRADWQYGDNQLHQQLSPRLAVIWSDDSDWALDASVGRFYQVTHLLDLPFADGATEYAEPQKSDHYVLGAIYRPTPRWQGRIALYQKKIFSPKTRYENLFNPYRLLPELAGDRVLVAASSSLAKGIELSGSLQWNKTWQYSASFAFGEAEDNLETGVQNRSWSQTRTLHLSAVYDQKPWQLSVHGYWGSGRPYTRMPQTLAADQIPYVPDRNQASLPDTYRLDIKASYFWRLPASMLEAYLDVSNVFGYEPVDYHEVTAVMDANEWQIQSLLESATPRIPVVGVKWVF